MIKEITPETRSLIENFCEELLCQFTSNETLKGFCFTISFPLSIYLESKGFNNSIAYGTYDNNHHYWINLSDYSDLIVDATIAQFKTYQGINRIHIGSKKEFNYKELEDETLVRTKRISQARICWLKKLRNDDNLKKINIEIAVKVINGIEENELLKNSNYIKYREDMKGIINSIENVEIKKKFKSKLPESMFE